MIVSSKIVPKIFQKDAHWPITIPVCMVATETPALWAVTLEILATGADWIVTSINLATGC